MNVMKLQTWPNYLQTMIFRFGTINYNLRFSSILLTLLTNLL